MGTPPPPQWHNQDAATNTTVEKQSEGQGGARANAHWRGTGAAGGVREAAINAHIIEGPILKAQSTTQTCDHGIGATLMQITEKVERVVSFVRAEIQHVRERVPLAVTQKTYTYFGNQDKETEPS
jgi:hypothetical protein